MKQPVSIGEDENTIQERLLKGGWSEVTRQTLNEYFCSHIIRRGNKRRYFVSSEHDKWLLLVSQEQESIA